MGIESLGTNGTAQAAQAAGEHHIHRQGVAPETLGQFVWVSMAAQELTIPDTTLTLGAVLQHPVKSGVEFPAKITHYRFFSVHREGVKD
jgi:hypothetical protein